MAKTTIDYGCGTVDIEVSAWTLAVYEQEFHADLIQDFYGKVKLEDDDDGGVLLFDYTSRNWHCVLKALWACVKANNDCAPSFKEWSKKTEGFNLYMVWSDLITLFNENFFRSSTPRTEEEGEREQEKE